MCFLEKLVFEWVPKNEVYVGSIISTSWLDISSLRVILDILQSPLSADSKASIPELNNLIEFYTLQEEKI